MEIVMPVVEGRRHDIHHSDTQNNNMQHSEKIQLASKQNDTQHTDTQHKTLNKQHSEKQD
jgi:hypothetical protein